MDYKDYYSTLGVAKSASQDEIQRSYRKLARKFHPDINKDPAAEARFKEINEAYEVLKDPEKRSKYDRFGSAWKQAQKTGAPPPGFEDIFSQFGGAGGGFGGPGGPGSQGTRIDFDFGNLGGGFGGAGAEGFSSFFEMLFGSGRPGRVRPRPSRGADHEARITLPLEEASRGGKREIQLTDPATGRRKTLRVKIPAGIRPGQKIRLAGQGGAAGGGRGDLYLTVEHLPHPSFRLEGADLHTTVPVSPWEAALGSTARIRTLEGEVEVKIPPASSSGRKIRLRGKGFPAGNGTRGDLLAEIRIVVPDELSEGDRALFKELAESSQFRPRG